MSMTMALNLWFITFLLMLHFNVVIPFLPIEINIFSDTKIDAFLSFFISYLLPILAVNYLLIFRNNRYEELLELYKPHNGMFFIRYFIGSLSLLVLYFLIAFIITY